MIVIRCDRCGGICDYTEKRPKRDYSDRNKMGNVCLVKDDSESGYYIQYDLCKKCLNQLIRFLGGEKGD